MSPFVFPDTTVLCNFAAVDRLDVLESVLRGRGRWVEAVADEVENSAAYLPALASIPREGGWLGDPVDVDHPNDVLDLERVRRAVFGGPAEKPFRHLGEAQTYWVIRNRTEFAGSTFVSDDKQAVKLGARNGLRVQETHHLVALAVQAGGLTQDQGYALLRAMQSKERKLRLPDVPAQLSRPHV